MTRYVSPVNPAVYPHLAVTLLVIGLFFTAWFFVYPFFNIFNVGPEYGLLFHIFLAEYTLFEFDHTPPPTKDKNMHVRVRMYTHTDDRQ